MAGCVTLGMLLDLSEPQFPNRNMNTLGTVCGGPSSSLLSGLVLLPKFPAELHVFALYAVHCDGSWSLGPVLHPEGL